MFHGIILQETGSKELHFIGIGDKIIFQTGYEEYCHWHNGPLDRRDNPLERDYCLKEAFTELGYCLEHKNSLRATYTKCFSAAGLESMRNCWKLDEFFKDKLSYTVYLLVYGHNKFKVGITREWRLYHRIGEQPHVVATILYRTSSAVKARDIEVKAGKIEGLTERPRRVLKEVIRSPIGQHALRLNKMREKLARVLKLDVIEDSFLFRVEPADPIEEYMSAKEVSYESITGKRVEILGYYAGYLLLADVNTNDKYIVRASRTMHRDTIKVLG